MIRLQSVGVSCQTRHQLEHFVRDVNKPDIELTPGMFDWLICPPASLAKLLASGIPVFEAGEIMAVNGRAYWPRFDLYFWHGFTLPAKPGRRLDIDGTFATMRLKFELQRKKFREVDPSSTMFVFSNSQNNLATEVYRSGHPALQIGKDAVDAMEEALGRYFGRKCRTLLVTNRNRASADALEDARVAVITPDHSEWKGDRAGWKTALGGALASNRQA
jgi:hypothetical protein